MTLAPRSAAFAVALAAFTVLAGCGQASGNDVVTLRMWGIGREGEVLPTLLRDFERENPGVRVRVQQIPLIAAHEKLLTAYVGDATPDVTQLGNTWIAELAEIGAIEPLDSLITVSDGPDATQYFPGIWDTNVIDGSVYGLPWYVDTRLLFYRKDILARAGYRTMPETWDAWRKALEAVKREVGPDNYAIFLPIDEWQQPVIFGLQTGAPLLRDGGRYGAFEEASFRRAFAFDVSLYHDGLAPTLTNQTVANAYQRFARGFFAMWITGPWNIGEFERRLPPELQDQWGTAPLPGPSGDSSGVSVAGGSSLVIFRRSAHKRESWRLIQFLSRPDIQHRLFELTGDLPAREEAWRDSSLMNGRYTHAFWVQLHRMRATPKIPEWEQLTSKLVERAEVAIRGRTSIDAALAGLDADANALLEKRRWMLQRAAERRQAEER
jgi:multiple sugar transport system substrate-binding protein